MPSAANATAAVPNSRTEARDKRRQQLIAATMKCIGRKGIGGTTLGDVAKEAGLSQGIVNLHFQSKDNLLRETLESLAEEYRSSFMNALEKSQGSATASLMALMELDLSRSICQRSKLAVWFAFWGEVKSRPTYAKICDEVDRYYDEVVDRLCADIVADGSYEGVDPAAVARALTAMTNGLWLSCLISPKDWDRDLALDSVRQYLAAVFPEHFSSTGVI
jgi:TetR/AcrR family transcriptional repressor of bet genes